MHSIENPVVGLLGFAAVKLVGYSLFARTIRRKYADERHSPIVIGAVRTGLGMAGGAAQYGGLWLAWVAMGKPGDTGGASFLSNIGMLGILGYPIGTSLVRAVEWWVVIRIYFRRRIRVLNDNDWWVIGGGVFWSFVLDIPAFLGLVIVSEWSMGLFYMFRL